MSVFEKVSDQMKYVNDEVMVVRVLLELHEWRDAEGCCLWLVTDVCCLGDSKRQRRLVECEQLYMSLTVCLK